MSTALLTRRPAPAATARRRNVHLAVLDGDVTAASGARLAAISADAQPGAAIVLDCTGLQHLDSGGVGQLVVMLLQARRRRQRVAAFGLSPHQRAILAVTRLDEVIAVHDDLDAAVAAQR